MISARTALLVIVVAAASIAVAAPASAVTRKKKKKPAATPVPVATATATPWVLDMPNPPFVEKAQSPTRTKSPEAIVYAALEPAVVGVIVSRPLDRGGNSQGSAFVVHSSGLFVTNFHVVNNAAEIRVRFSDGKTFSARLAGADPALDLAVLRVDAPEGETRPIFPVAELGDSDGIQPGDPVLALGVPLGMGPTITRGILSGKDRRVDVATFGAGFDVGFLQTDAAINLGSSGGPLVDLDGAVIGVTSATLPTARGISFAIPINAVKKALPEILRHAGVSRAWLGLTLAPPLGSGADVIGVRPGGPADRAGLQTGDIVTEIRGRDLRSDSDLVAAMKDLAVHETVELRYRRRGKVLSALLTATDVPIPGSVKGADAVSLGGATLAEFGAQSAAAAMSGQSSGVLFASVPLGSGADKAGVKTGDVVVVLGIDSVADMDDVRILLDRIGDAEAFKLLVRRGEKTLTVIVPR